MTILLAAFIYDPPDLSGIIVLGVINFIRTSFTPGCVHSSITAAPPLLNVASLDEDSILNYCPLSKLPLQR